MYFKQEYEYMQNKGKSCGLGLATIGLAGAGMVLVLFFCINCTFECFNANELKEITNHENEPVGLLALMITFLI